MRYFKLKEFTDSITAKARGIENTPTPEAIANIELLVSNILDPAREKFGSPIKINSGYRTKELNKAVKGSDTSQHMRGQAADITSKDNFRLFNLLKSLPFDQLIWERGGQWVHVSYNEGYNRRMIMWL